MSRHLQHGHDCHTGQLVSASCAHAINVHTGACNLCGVTPTPEPIETPKPAVALADVSRRGKRGV